MATSPAGILDLVYQRVAENIDSPVIGDRTIVERVELVARSTTNRACVRFILACALAKASRPEVDIRKPYTEIGDSDVYSGRTHDESCISKFVSEHKLPCNPTTAFLTPAFRNRNIVMTPTVNLVGRPASVYKAALQLLDDVHIGKLSAEDLLAETARWLLLVRNERRQRMETLLASLKSAKGETTLSAEGIVALVEQHLNLKRASRLPVLVVAAAYRAAQDRLGEQVLPLQGHTAADRQTGSLGDLEITLVSDQQIITSYEMKTRRVTELDIDHALGKVASGDKRIDNYIFITTKPIDQDVEEYAASMYEKTGVEREPGGSLTAVNQER